MISARFMQCGPGAFFCGSCGGTESLFIDCYNAFASKPAPTRSLCSTQIPCGSGLAREGGHTVTAAAPPSESGY
ncbi:hypothetical protein C9422_16895 [Pseudomonas sp. B1(2018)]|nr:hypothetical protein C9422_16895 [Pseudomonas sp. B1(2018)]